MGTPPTLYEWAGGLPAFERLTAIFYQRVTADPLLGPVFTSMSAEHAKHVAVFIAEVFGGPAKYSAEHGGHPAMIRHHLLRHLTEPQRSRWVALISACADEAGLPSDPEFRSAFVAYLEWGSRLAVINSADGAQVVVDAPMPAWGWGVPGAPYVPKL
ncbi:MAG: group II truncated hemoglobin [Archangium sp.]|nr:group II truncated hemoglobin [Archangium sp.]